MKLHLIVVAAAVWLAAAQSVAARASLDREGASGELLRGTQSPVLRSKELTQAGRDLFD